MSAPSITRSQTQEARAGMTISMAGYWHRAVLAAIVLLTAALDFWGLTAEGYGNQYYAAGVRSMSESWHNFFFSSFDPGGFVTVDKPPLGFWFQVASVKLFGFHGVSLLLPQALAGVLSVLLLYVLVSRPFGRVAGLIAALVLALSPISVVTNRNNTIDSTLTLFVLAGAWCVLRAARTGRLRWLLLSALLVGLGFNIKMLEAFLVVPAFGLVYLLGARVGWGRRLWHLVLAGIVLLVVSLSWVLAVDLTPASQRPWVGSTSTNSELDLAIGYNGLQRLTGQRRGGGAGFGGFRAVGGIGAGAADFPRGAAGGPGGFGENGAPGPLRLLDTQLGSQIGWLLPLAVLGFVLAGWQSRPRVASLDDRQRSLLLWGGWLATMGVFFSVAGFFHTYYLVMMAPSIAALSGIAVVSLWRAYRQPDGRLPFLLPLGLLAVAAVQVHLLSDYPDWSKWLTPLVVGLCVLAAAALVLLRIRPGLAPGAALWAALVAVLALLAPPASWSVDAAAQGSDGNLLRAGPAAGSSSNLGVFPGRDVGAFPPPGSGSGAPLPPGGTFGSPPGGPAGGPPAGFPGRFRGGRYGYGRGGRGFGGFRGRSANVNNRLLTFLERHRGSTKFLVATRSATEAAPFIIQTGLPVMALGGFIGSDPIMTPAKLSAAVKSNTVRYFLLGGFGGRGGDSADVSGWVDAHCALVPSSAYSSTTSTTGFDTGALYDCARSSG